MLRPALALFGILLLTTMLATWLSTGEATESPALTAWFTGIDALIVLAFVAADWRAIGKLLWGPWVTSTGLLCICGALAAMFIVINGYFWALTSIVGTDTYDYTAEFRAHDWPPWSAYLLISICPAIFEELAVRGVIMTRLERVLRPTEALVLQAALFSIMHLTPLIFISHFLMGLAMGWARAKTGSLYPGMIIHAIWNAFVLMSCYAAV